MIETTSTVPPQNAASAVLTGSSNLINLFSVSTPNQKKRVYEKISDLSPKQPTVNYDSIIKQLKFDVKFLLNRLESIESTVDKHIHDSVKLHFDKIFPPLAANYNNSASNNQHSNLKFDLINEVAFDMHQREWRKHSLVLFGIEESISSESSHNNDQETVESLMAMLGVQKRSIKSIKRFTNLPKSRPIRVLFSQNINCSVIIKNAFKLSRTKYEKISICHDLTPAEQHKLKKLKEIRDIKNAELKSDVDFKYVIDRNSLKLKQIKIVKSNNIQPLMDLNPVPSTDLQKVINKDTNKLKEPQQVEKQKHQQLTTFHKPESNSLISSLGFHTPQHHVLENNQLVKPNSTTQQPQLINYETPKQSQQPKTETNNAKMTKSHLKPHQKQVKNSVPKAEQQKITPQTCSSSTEPKPQDQIKNHTKTASIQNKPQSTPQLVNSDINLKITVSNQTTKSQKTLKQSCELNNKKADDMLVENNSKLFTDFNTPVKRKSRSKSVRNSNKSNKSEVLSTSIPNSSQLKKKELVALNIKLNEELIKMQNTQNIQKIDILSDEMDLQSS
ncbi:unnamed protein product [Brachionus calyciflorus]|uniref:Uncharacterized protein n=1 Tax=Brachionus calyciflorus TaxID=104777 RepID=A0A814LST9_9BILA|nr:unnamed protein product [Brachionus calyciflorus]